MRIVAEESKNGLRISAILGVWTLILGLLTTIDSAAAAPRAELCQENWDSVGVVIGNSDYRRSIPDVPYAVNDARAIRKLLVDGLCYRDGNIIHLENATFGDLLKMFGHIDSPHGQLWNWVREGRSNVFVYYSGHGAPDIRTGEGFLVPVDGDPNDATLGLPLKTLVTNLKALKKERIGTDRKVTLVLDACFSGKEGTGKPLIKGSFTGWTPNRPDPGDDIVQFSAAAADEIARWDEQKKLGLFTGVFLDGIRGEADTGHSGNKDGAVTSEELLEFVSSEVSYLARRRFGDEQTPDLPRPEQFSWRFEVAAITLAKPPVSIPAPALKCDEGEIIVDGKLTCAEPRRSRRQIVEQNDRYVKYLCGEILDKHTNLIWYVGPDYNITWDEAKNWVRNLASCDSTSWRLPSTSELRTLHDSRKVAGTGYFTGGRHWPAKMDNIFRHIGGGSWVWSSRSRGKKAKSFNYNQGKEVEYAKTNTEYSTRVFAVRDAD